jgi:isoquinoline 1-oxidoreductase beta subunit
MPFLAHAPMEPVNCVAWVHDGGCEIWTSTQVQARAQAAAAAGSGVPAEKVTLHNLVAGGAFGRRLEVDFITQAARIARKLHTPVKVTWSREEDIQRDLYRPYYLDRMQAGLAANGRIVAWSHRIVGSSVMARFAPPALGPNGLDPDAVDCAAQPIYDFPNFRVDYVRCEPPGVPTAFWRGVGPTHNVFVMESFIDECAAAARQDAVAYRRAMLQHSPRALRTLDLAVEKSGWQQKLPQRSGRGVAVVYVFDTYLTVVAQVAVSPEGQVRVERVVCAVDCGTVVHPDNTAAQIEGGVLFGLSAALFSEITIEGGRTVQSNFHDYRTLRMSEVPAIEVHLAPSGDAPGGIGETGTIAAAPALANAIFAATGVRIRKLPVKGIDLKQA